MTDSGLQFDFSYAAGTSWEQMLAFETAGLMWSDYIEDDMTVNIHVEMTNTLPDNVIGGALPGMVADVNYTDFRNAYSNDVELEYERDKALQDNEDKALQTYQRNQHYFDSLSLLREGYGGKGPEGTWEKFEARINFGGGHYVEDSGELNMTRANAKALGLIAGNDTALDGYIMMNDLSSSSLDWDYSQDWTPGESLDFLSTAVHEIGHVLGFVSGVDKYEGVHVWDVSSFWNHFGTFDAFKSYTNDILDHANPLDLFRYSQESLDIGNNPNINRNIIDLSIGTQAYFGPARLWDAYATGKQTSIDGDGFQASHWKHNDNNSNIIGIMDPLMTPGVIRRISDRDLRAMDSIGYDVNNRGEALLERNTASNNWRPSTGQNTDMGTLQWRGKDRIAKKMYRDGQASWYNDWAKYEPWKANEMARDRGWEIDDMIDRSHVYEGRRSGRTYSRQEIFFAESYFSSINAQYLNTSSESSLEMPIASESIMEVERAGSTIYSSETETDILTVDNQSNVKISTVDMSLISSSKQDAIDTVSTELNLELIEEVSLYSDRSEAPDLVVSLA